MYHLRHAGDVESPFRGMRRIPGNVSNSFKSARTAVTDTAGVAFGATGAAFAQVPPTVGDWSKTFASTTAYSAKGAAKTTGAYAASAASATGTGAAAAGQAAGAGAGAASKGAVKGAKAFGHAIVNIDQVSFKPSLPKLGGGDSAGGDAEEEEADGPVAVAGSANPFTVTGKLSKGFTKGFNKLAGIDPIGGGSMRA